MSQPEREPSASETARAAQAWLERDHAATAREVGAARADTEAAAVARLTELLGVVYRLRDEGGCPWDRKQTLASMLANLSEEAAEVAEAVSAGNDPHTAEELGDVLMNVFLMARIGEQEQRFSLSEVAAGIAEKLVRRHAHVFGEVSATDADAALASWKATKRAEKGGPPESVLDGVPPGLDALRAGVKLGGKAADVGFDWPSPAGALDKLREELGELEEAMREGDLDHVEDELGDVLFSAANLARKLKLDPELALRRTLAKFRRRFAHIEATLGERLGSVELDELERLWREAAKGDSGAAAS